MNIDELLPYIKDKPEFIVADKGNYKVINYNYMHNDTFDKPELLQCRGIKFNPDGTLLARPFHKFFNFMEKPEHKDIDWSRPHVVMPKLDGSMIHSALLDNKVVFMTQMGCTEHAERAERHLNNTLRSAIGLYEKMGYTSIFEWTAPDNQIVIPYEESKLTLLAVRHKQQGYYLSPDDLKMVAQIYGVDCVEFFQNSRYILSSYKEHSDIEGYVIWFTDNHFFIKLKTDEYVSMHRAVSFFERKDMVLACVLESNQDDLYSALSEERADKLRKFADEVIDELALIEYDIITTLMDITKIEDYTRKEFALHVNENVEKHYRAAYFAALDGKPILEAVKICMNKNPDKVKAEW